MKGAVKQADMHWTIRTCIRLVNINIHSYHHKRTEFFSKPAVPTIFCCVLAVHHVGKAVKPIPCHAYWLKKAPGYDVFMFLFLRCYNENADSAAG